jgi:hypothetical protein
MPRPAPTLAALLIAGSFLPGASADDVPDAPRLVAPRLVEGEPPAYPAGAEGEARVVVSLLVGSTGEVIESEVIESGGEPFDAVSLARATELVFDPATSNGEPIAARIRLVFSFAPPSPAPPDAPDAPLPPAEPEVPVAPRGILAGQVFERGSRDVLTDVRVESGERVVFVDEGGCFEMEVDEGLHAVLVVRVGYRPLHVAVEVGAGERVEMAFRLDREGGVRPFETVVHGRRHAEEVSRISLSAEEIHALPGTMGDPFRVIETLPGVTPVITGLPYYFVRGAPPAGTGYYLDGVRVPLLFHLALGPAVVHPSLVDRIDFFPGGAPAELGRYIGGIVRARTRLPASDRWRSEWDLRLTDVGAFVEVPILDELRIAVSGRYGYPGWLVRAIEPSAYLDFWDYQFRLEWDAAPEHRVTLFSFGSFDEAGELEDDGTVDGVRIQFHRVDARYEYDPGGEMRVEASGWFGYDATRMEEDAEIAMWAGGPRAVVHWSPLDRLDLQAGVDVEARRFRNPFPADEDDPEFDAYLRPRDALLIGSWVSAVFRPDPRTDLSVGLRYDVHRIDETTESWVDVRFAIRHRLAESLWIKGTAGSYHQPQSFLIDLPGLGSFVRDTGPQRAWQIAQGIEVELPWALGLDVQVWWSDFANLAEPDLEPPESDDEWDDEFDWLGFLDGRSYGLEILLRRRLGEDLFGWIAYTLGRSERDYAAGGAVADFDQTHVLNLVVSWDIGWGWRLGGRFHVRSGRPYTPVCCDPGPPYLGGDCVPTGDRNSGRLPPFYRLDLRVDKRWTFETWWFALYFEFVNVTFTPEAIDMRCECWEDPQVAVEEVPYLVIPTLGFRGVY